VPQQTILELTHHVQSELLLSPASKLEFCKVEELEVISVDGLMAISPTAMMQRQTPRKNFSVYAGAGMQMLLP
jgi:hypothetical protein